MGKRIAKWIFIAAAAPVMPLAGTVSAQDYPTRPVRVINPFAPGGPVDVIGRLITSRLSESWGQPVIVDNRPSAARCPSGRNQTALTRKTGRKASSHVFDACATTVTS